MLLKGEIDMISMSAIDMLPKGAIDTTPRTLGTRASVQPRQAGMQWEYLWKDINEHV